jgi:CheY-like chemotaxis protein/HPt (histidine-containing phosphotransfer) domain-containing protein
MLSIRTRVILIISAIIAGITAAGVIIGITLTRRNLIKTIENDMSVSGAIAEQLVAEKVVRIHADMRLAAEKCRGLDETQTREVLLYEAVELDYLDIGLIDSDGNMVSCGVKPPNYKISENTNARRAFNGETVMSTAQFNNHGDFIMQFWLPLEDGRAVVASMPGTVISDGWSLGVAYPIAENPIARQVYTFLISGAIFLGLGILVAFFDILDISKIESGKKELAENLMGFRYSMARQDRNKQLVRTCIPHAKVLVVDDVATNLDLARGIMKPYGMTVDCVGGDRAAIDLIRRGEPRYNAVFMDHMMPGMDGIETVRIIRNEIDSDYARNIPIIALTANAIIGNEKLFLNNGFQDFLTKPIDIMKINGAINRWVRDRDLEKELGLDVESRLVKEAQNTENKKFDKKGKKMERQIAELIRNVRVEGLDAEKGLERFGGDGKSYVDSLRSYVVHTPPLLEAARATDALADYAITVHGIKGSSYSVSADLIGQKAEQLEHAAKTGNADFVKRENETFINAAEEFIANLTGLLDVVEEDMAKPRKDAPDPVLLSRIYDAAENYDVNELDEVMEELEQCVYELDTTLVPWLREQIDKSDFEEILERIIPDMREEVLFVEA